MLRSASMRLGAVVNRLVPMKITTLGLLPKHVRPTMPMFTWLASIRLSFASEASRLVCSSIGGRR